MPEDKSKFLFLLLSSSKMISPDVVFFPSTTTMISGAASDRAGDARAVRPVAGVDRRRPREIRVGGTFSRLAPAFVALARRDRRAHPPTPTAPRHHCRSFKTQKRSIVAMSVVAVNAMTRAVLAPKAAGAKPRASAFVGRPAALKARVAGTRHRRLPTNRQISISFCCSPLLPSPED